MIENIKGFGSKLEFYSLHQAECAVETKVNLPGTRSTQSVPSQTAHLPGRDRKIKCSRIEPSAGGYRGIINKQRRTCQIGTAKGRTTEMRAFVNGNGIGQPSACRKD